MTDITKTGNQSSVPVSEAYEYDSLDRLIKTTKKIGTEKSMVTENEYDLYGRLSGVTYPGSLRILNNYDENGNLLQISKWSFPYRKSIWEAREENALGQITREQKGSSEVVYSYTPQGLLKSIYWPSVVNMQYIYRTNSELDTRYDILNGQSEAYAYDSQNRLVSWDVLQGRYYTRAGTMNYNAVTGNINSRTDVGSSFNYGENGAGPHALSSISGKPSVVPSTQQNITYTDFKKVKSITEGSRSLQITYGIDEQRIKEVEKDGTTETVRYFSDNYEEEHLPDGTIRSICYICNGNSPVAVYIKTDEPDTGNRFIGDIGFASDYVLHYLQTDRQGSLIALADENGSLLEKYAYNPWGKRINPDNWLAKDARTSFKLNRGYTMHQHLDGFGLINMSGRVYDPVLGMFLSPDPYVQNPGSWLNYNRYGYCMNNPLMYIDPSGEFAWFVPVIIGAVIGAYTGGVIANEGQYNPLKWDYSSAQTWGYMFGGALVGGISGYAGWSIAGSGIPMANTAATAGASFINSVGTYIYTGGQTPISISFGVASYDFTNKSWSYLGKKGNKWYENLSYGLGAMANLSDIMTGLHPKGIDLVTEHSDNVGHSALVNEGTTTGVPGEYDPNALISVGPDRINDPTGSWHWMEGTNNWASYSAGDSSHPRWVQNLKVNMNTIKKYANWLNTKEGAGKLLYSVELSSCVTHTSRALNLSGLFNIGIHPYILNAQMYLWSNGIRPWTYSYHLIQKY